MFGLMVLGSAALYLGLMFWVVRWAWRKGRANGGSVARAAMFAFVGFLAVYLPVFWNHVPVLLAHRSMCAKDAGFTAFVPAEQWRAEHAAQVKVALALPREQREKTLSSARLPDGFTRDVHFNGLLTSDLKAETFLAWGVSITRAASRRVDQQSGVVLATAVDYSIGTQDDLRMWLRKSSCVARPPYVAGQPAEPVQPFDFLVVYSHRLKGE
jgi:hypothetical protein